LGYNTTKALIGEIRRELKRRGRIWYRLINRLRG
jgi:hypothetical protein